MKIGKIISVEYDKFRVKLFHTTKNSSVNIDGKVYYFGNIGSYLKTINSSGEYILCEVSSIVDWIGTENNIYSTFNLDSSKEIIIKPIGTLKYDKFSMGVGIFPSLYSDVEIVTYDDLDKILSFNEDDNRKGIHSRITIGKSKSLINYDISLDINRLFNIHTAVLGNSGSGKSNTIAHILHEVYRKENNYARGAKTIIFDANGEYPIAFTEEAELDKSISSRFYKPNISSDNIHQAFVLPYYLMNTDEWLSFLLASERTQKPFWDKVLQESYKFYKIFNSKDKEVITKFVNYIKWKLYKILFNIVTRVDSDTSKMTAAKGAISMMKTTCINSLGGKQNCDEIQDLFNFLDVCDKLCVVNFGNNNDSLSNALSQFTAADENAIKYIHIEPQYRGANIEKYETCIDDEKHDNCFVQIVEQKALKIEQDKLRPGEYFDYNYLQSAVDIVLLEEESHGNLHIRDFVSTMLSRLDYFLYNSECDFMRINTVKYLNSTEYLENIFGISEKDDKKYQLITIDTSEVGTDVLELMTSVISRMIFDYRKTQNGEKRQKNPVHLILDEAHRYIQKNANYIMRENIFEKIAREGRKYSLYLIISSQRPSELSQTVLSQCGNYIVHRIQNEVDMKYIYSVLPYFSEDYLTKIRQAVPGEALVFGNCVPMPLMIKVNEADPAPNSKNCDIRDEWFRCFDA